MPWEAKCTIGGGYVLVRHEYVPRNADMFPKVDLFRKRQIWFL